MIAENMIGGIGSSLAPAAPKKARGSVVVAFTVAYQRASMPCERPSQATPAAGPRPGAAP
ncbi:MAG TPA: hypothetical protein VFS00_32295 [Polyangiaceae bacterium]|nr:hypothetical protein [Polyangiaceae bacterium]